MRIDSTEKMLVQGSTVFFLADLPKPFNKASAFFTADPRLHEGVNESVAQRVAAAWNATGNVSMKDLLDCDTPLSVPELPYTKVLRQRTKALRLVCALAEVVHVHSDDEHAMLNNFLELARNLTEELGVNPAQFLRENPRA